MTARQIGVAALVLAALIWAMWVTRVLIEPRGERLVSARLSSIVGDYVRDQARSASPPARVEAEMKAFMGALDREIARRGARGDIILVAEAVLTSNVPDITEPLRSSVYAAGVPRPSPRAANDPGRFEPLRQGSAIAGVSTAVRGATRPDAAAPRIRTRGAAPVAPPAPRGDLAESPPPIVNRGAAGGELDR